MKVKQKTTTNILKNQNEIKKRILCYDLHPQNVLKTASQKRFKPLMHSNLLFTWKKRFTT